MYVFYEERFFVYHRCESIAISTILTCDLEDFCTVCTLYHKIAIYDSEPFLYPVASNGPKVPRPKYGGPSVP